MANKNVLNLLESEDGNRIKQGDKSVMQYVLDDTDNDDLDLNGKTAIVYLSDRTGLRYKYDTTVQDNKVDVVINAVLPKGVYTLEIVVDDKYIFPSDNKAKIEITESVVGKQSTINQDFKDYDSLLKFALENHKFDNVIDFEVFKKLNGQIRLFIGKGRHDDTLQLPVFVNDLVSFDKSKVDVTIKSLTSNISNFINNNLNNYLRSVNKTYSTASHDEVKEAFHHLDTDWFTVDRGEGSLFPFQMTRYVNNEVVKQETYQRSFDIDLDDFKEYIAIEPNARLEVKYIYKGEPIDFGKLDVDLSSEISGGGIYISLNTDEKKDINANLLKGTKDYTRPFYRINKITKDDVTYAKLIEDDGEQNVYVSQEVTLEPNTQYTVSFDTFSDSKSKLDVSVGDSNRDYITRSYLIVKQDVERKSVTFTTTDDSKYEVGIYADRDETVQAYVAHIKLEKGNVATDYIE